jgi:hypothetical protein
VKYILSHEFLGIKMENVTKENQVPSSNPAEPITKDMWEEEMDLDEAALAALGV